MSALGPVPRTEYLRLRLAVSVTAVFWPELLTILHAAAKATITSSENLKQVTIGILPLTAGIVIQNAERHKNPLN